MTTKAQQAELFRRQEVVDAILETEARNRAEIDRQGALIQRLQADIAQLQWKLDHRD